MTDTADRQLGRIIQLVAELSRREREGEPPLRLAEVAALFGVAPADVERDIRTLTTVSDAADHDWLGSLSVLQEGDQIALSSRGHFRRPVRLTPEEALAIQVGLAEDGAETPLAAELAALLSAGEADAARWRTAESRGPDEARTVDIARQAAGERRCLELLYAGSGRAPARRTIEVHQVLSAGGRFYLVAWCRAANGKRHFRADRVLEAKLLDETFTRRPEMREPRKLFEAPPESRETVTVRFAAGIARWIAEQHPDATREADGRVSVRYDVSDPAWLMRTVLQYGPEAEVLDPPAYRALMRSSVVA